MARSFRSFACTRTVNRRCGCAVAITSWTAAVLCRFCTSRPDRKAPEDWRSPKPGGTLVGSWNGAPALRSRLRDHEPGSHKASNDERRMTKKSKAQMSKCSELCGRRFRHSDLVVLSDFVIRHSGFNTVSCHLGIEFQPPVRHIRTSSNTPRAGRTVAPTPGRPGPTET